MRPRERHRVNTLPLTSSVNASSSRPCDLSSELITRPISPRRSTDLPMAPSSTSCRSIICSCCCMPDEQALSLSRQAACDEPPRSPHPHSCCTGDGDMRSWEERPPLDSSVCRSLRCELARPERARLGWAGLSSDSRASFACACRSRTKSWRAMSSEGVSANFAGSRSAMSIVACMSCRSTCSSESDERIRCLAGSDFGDLAGSLCHLARSAWMSLSVPRTSSCTARKGSILATRRPSPT